MGVNEDFIQRYGKASVKSTRMRLKFAIEAVKLENKGQPELLLFLNEQSHEAVLLATLVAFIAAPGALASNINMAKPALDDLENTQKMMESYLAKLEA